MVPEHARFVYVDEPGKTAAAWRETPQGPAFSVGDLGRVDEDGYVFLDGRREDLVITGGVNVYPLEVEQVLGEHPGVVDVAVYGVPDERWGQRVCASRGRHRAGRPSSTRGPASGSLPPKRPKSWTFLPELPRTLTGKVLRDRLPGPPELTERRPRSDRCGRGRRRCEPPAVRAG